MQWWAAWVEELEDHPLDQFEYLGALECRDGFQDFLASSGDTRTADLADEIDARFQDVTIEDSRFADHFESQVGTGWWWLRLPKSQEAQAYIFRDW